MTDKKKIRTKHFTFKELRLSIAHMVLWSLLTIAFFTYLTIEFGKKLEYGPFYFILLIAGYVGIVIVLTLVFTHRLLGPFERLKTELRIILSGDYRRRLCIRGKDDIYIRSFIAEVNKLMDNLEKMHNYKEEYHRKLDHELLNLETIIDKKEISREELREAITLLHKKIEE